MLITALAEGQEHVMFGYGILGKPVEPRSCGPVGTTLFIVGLYLPVVDELWFCGILDPPTVVS